MWIHPIAILARGENPIVGVIAVLVIIGLSLLSKWLSAKQQREQQEEARQKELEKGRRPGQVQQPADTQAPPPRETGAGGPSRLVRRTPYQQPAPPAGGSHQDRLAPLPQRLDRLVVLGPVGRGGQRDAEVLGQRLKLVKRPHPLALVRRKRHAMRDEQ